MLRVTKPVTPNPLIRTSEKPLSRTMKTLFLLRHAKSSWSHLSLDDHDRPLKKRGLKAAPRMGAVLRGLDLRPEQVLCSTALRAQETWRLVQAELSDGDRIPVSHHADFYHCEPTQFVTTLKHVAEPAACVLIVGHNPDLESFLTQLTGESHRLSTAALVRLTLSIEAWSDMTATTRGQLDAIWRPRELQ